MSNVTMAMKDGNLSTVVVDENDNVIPADEFFPDPYQRVELAEAEALVIGEDNEGAEEPAWLVDLYNSDGLPSDADDPTDFAEND